jgi:hypothetical protein
MRKKKTKGKQKPTVKLSQMEQLSLRSTRKLLHDSGLKMPRITNKYWSALKTLSQYDATSFEFYTLQQRERGNRFSMTNSKSLGMSGSMANGSSPNR